MNTWTDRSGFTLIEAMTSLVIFGIVVAGLFIFYNGVMAQAKSGAAQSYYLAMARQAEQRVSAYIQEGKAVGVESNAIVILQTSDEVSKIEYIDMDQDPLTVSNNIIRYDPSVWVSGDEELICNYVRYVDGMTNMFSSLPLSPAAVRVAFHVGDSTDPMDSSSLMSGKGYQGFEVHFSAAPRNLQYWYR